MNNTSQQPNEDNRKIKRNLARFHGDAAVSAVDEAAGNYQSPSIIAAGADVQSITVLTTLMNLCLSLVCLKAPGIIERIGKTKRGAVIFAFLNICAWVPLISAFFLSSYGIGPVWFALLWLVNIIPGILLTFQRDNWLSNLVPTQKLGRYLGQRLAIKSAFYLGAFCFLGYMLDSMGNENLTNFAVVFTVALTVALLDFVIFTFMHDPQKPAAELIPTENKQIKFGMFNYLGDLKTKKLDVFVAFTSLFYLTVGLSGPLYAVYMLEEQHFSYLSFTVIVAAEYLARVISVPFWGRFADRSGNIRVLSVVSKIIPAIPIAWLFCSNVGYLACVQIASGVCWGAFDLCTQSYVYKVAPPEKKLRYIIYTRCLILFSTAVGGLGGYYLIRTIFPIFGSRTLTVFMISGLLRAIVVMILMPKLIDLAVSYYKPTNSPEVSLDTSGQYKISKHGLFYFRNRPATPVKRATIMQGSVPSYIRSPNADRQRAWVVRDKPGQAVKKGIIELPPEIKLTPRRSWLAVEGRSKMRMETEQRPIITPIRHPWVNNTDVHSAYAIRNRNQSQAQIEKSNREKSHREGLLHDNDGWNSLHRQILAADDRDNTRMEDTLNIRPVYEESRFSKWSGAPGSDTRKMLLKPKK